MNRAQRKFVMRSLQVLGWLAIAVYGGVILFAWYIRSSGAVGNAIVAAVYLSPIGLAGGVLLWIRRYLAHGETSN